jgi:RimJ/RimL family protein N-acetyltransferase
MVEIRKALKQDFEQIWKIFQPIVSAGETYPYPRNTSKEEAFRIWIKEPQKTFVCLENKHILGTYYLKQNQSGRGSHVCNCGYMVSADARGKGLATFMCEHSQKVARELNYKGMQFNLVVVSNEQAVRLWSKLGFETAGKITKAFQHPTLGYVDALIMYKWL